MLQFEPGRPIKETKDYLAKFPKFSLIQKITPQFYPTLVEASASVAQVIRNEIQKKNNLGQTFVLGLATGSTPIALYRELVRLHKQGELSFKNVVTFNLDEYYPIEKNNKESYNYYMNYHLFDHIDIPKENINIPNGQIDRAEVVNFCSNYQKKILSYGGIDIQILGVGRTGHIGFNEPPSPANSITRLVFLHRLTRKDAAGSFGGFDNVPKCAITMGIDTIRRAKKIFIMAWSQTKAEIVRRSIQEEKSNDVPSTFLHEHPDSTFILDKAAGEQLTRFNTPWVIKGDIQDPVLPKTAFWVLKSVCWLSLKVKKPFLRLTYNDYQDEHLFQLINYCAKGNVEDLNLYCYKKLMAKISGWPLGFRPQDSDNQGLASIAKKATHSEKILIFSPHPGNDVISMGATIKKLHEQGHDVYVAYMTSGTNGVFDHDAEKYLYFLKDFTNQFFWKLTKHQNSGTFICQCNNLMDKALKAFEQGAQQDRKTDLILAIKEFIRSSQSKMALGSIGIRPEKSFCLNLPFYRNTMKSNRAITEKDEEIVKSLMRLIEPTVIYAAGDFTDPHRTNRKCLQLLLKIKNDQGRQAAKDPNFKNLFPAPEKIFFYRGAWHEWTVPMARIIVPLSPKDVEQKYNAIIRHQSQKDNPMFPGDDKRQFWLRVQQRNRQTASTLHQLGFPDYEACECFVNLNDLNAYDEI